MKILQKNTILIIALFSFFALVACSKQETKLAQDTRPTVKVKLAKVGSATPASFTSVSGKIQAADYVTVSARMMGYITKVNAKVGDKIRAGQILVQLSNKDIQTKIAQVDAQILEAETGLNNIEKDYARIQSLFDKQSATQKELDDITTHRDMMKAKLKQAQEGKNEINTMLSYSVIKAPMSGIITEKWIQNGDLASPGKPLLSIESGSKFQAEAMVPESKIAQISKGDPVKVLIKSTGQEISGHISEYSHSAKNTGGQFLTKIDLDKKDLSRIKLFSGMYATVQLPDSKAAADTQQISVHKNAIVRQGQLTGLYTLGDGNTALLRWVRLGKSYGNQVEVLSGLTLGESYIVEKDGRLTDGVKIQIQ